MPLVTLRPGLAVLVSSIMLTPTSAADWPHWRGPDRDGTTSEPSGWADGRAWPSEKPIWTATVGRGASSPIVVGDRVYAFGWADGKDTVRGLDAATGREVWAVDYPTPQYGRHHVGDESFYRGPSGTPEYDPATKFLFTLGIDGDLHAWDTAKQGRNVWHVNLYDAYGAGQRPRLTRAGRRDYGYTSAPLVHGDWLLVEAGSARGTLVALNKTTGREVWRSKLTDEAGHTAGPVPITVAGVPCVAVLTLRNLAVIRLDADHEGETVAVHPFVVNFANGIASPAVKGEYVLITAAYNLNTMRKLKVTMTGIETVWDQKYPSKVCTPVIHGGHVYCVWQTVRCLDWETGEQKWFGGSFGDPGSCIVTGDGRLIVYGKDGKLALIETAQRSPGKSVVLTERDKLFRTFAWPHVALADGRLICKDRDGNVAVFATH